MASAIRAGDIRQLKINSREFDVKGGDSAVKIRLAGFQNEMELSGNGNPLIRQRRKLAGFSDCPIMVDDTNQDLEYLQSLADAATPVPVSMTLATGITYGGTLAIVSDLEKDTGGGVHNLEMRGQKFEQI